MPFRTRRRDDWTEGSLYDPPLAALAIKQAQGDLVEAAFPGVTVLPASFRLEKD